MTLYIDTTNRQSATLKLMDDESLIDTVEFDTYRKLSDSLLAQIITLLDKNNVSKADLTQIKVNQGPGSFTGTRVGVAVANALAFGLNISVNNEVEGFVLPEYDKDPAITISDKLREELS